jgi:hypothetical protein
MNHFAFGCPAVNAACCLLSTTQVTLNLTIFKRQLSRIVLLALAVLLKWDAFSARI